MIGSGLGLGLGRLSVLQGLEGTDDWILRIFVIFVPYVFEVKVSISRSFPKLPVSGDLENQGQLPVSGVL